jgi:hypothetical protein
MTTSAERNKDGLSITNGVSDRRRASPALNISVDVGAGESSLDTDRHIATQDTNVTSTRGSIESSSETTNSTSRPKNNVDGPIGSIGALHMVDAPRSDIAIHETQGAEAHSTRLQTPISASAPDEVERTKSTVATKILEIVSLATEAETCRLPIGADQDQRMTVDLNICL